MPRGGRICHVEMEYVTQRWSVLCGGGVCCMEMEYTAWRWSVQCGGGGGVCHVAMEVEVDSVMFRWIVLHRDVNIC